MTVRFFNNIKTICKNKKINIGKLENLIGVSTGYLSRQTNISLEKAYHIALLLDYDLTELIEKDLAVEIKKKELEEAKQKLQKEIDKLNGGKNND